MGRLNAKVSGKVDSDKFEGKAKLPLGSADITGIRKN
jgi:hypothetical protein